MDRVWDAGGEASAALAQVVQGFGAAVLGQADMLEGLLRDDVPVLPREVAMLTEIARYGVAGLLAERMRQGDIAPAAVSAVAAEVTSRTAVDATGALWATGVFARAIGYEAVSAPPGQAPGQAGGATLPPPADLVQPPATRPDSGFVPPVSIPRAGDGTAPPTRRLDGWSAGDGSLTLRPGDQVASWPPDGQTELAAEPPADAAVPAVVAARPVQAVVAALATAGTVILMLSWVLAQATHADEARAWVTMLPLLLAGGGIAIWAARDRPGGAGFAAVLGIAAPAVSFAIYDGAIAAAVLGGSPNRSRAVVAASVLAVLVALIAVALSVAALVRWRQLSRQKPGGLAIWLTILGVCFPLANIFAQLRSPDGEVSVSVLGPGVAGWFIIWGLAFLIFFAAPPVLAIFLRPGSPAHLAVWSGWLLMVASWQISDSPTDGLTAAYGLYLTWFLWLAVLTGTFTLSLRAGAQRSPQRR